MSKAELQALLHEEIDNGDEAMLSILYSMVQELHQPYELSEEQMRIVEDERAKYLRGEGRTYSWQEVKEMARTRQWPDDIAS